MHKRAIIFVAKITADLFIQWFTTRQVVSVRLAFAPANVKKTKKHLSAAKANLCPKYSKTNYYEKTRSRTFA